MRSGAPLSRGFLPLMKDTLTVEVFSAAAEDPNTGAPTGGGDISVFLSQPCADEDIPATRRAQYEIINGTPGVLPVSICLTSWFAMPELYAGQTVAYRVNGNYRPLLRQGPPIDAAGQHILFELILGAPESSR